MLARAGFDWLTLDIEHSAIDWSQAAMIFAAIADAGGVPLARVPKGNHDYIKRVLDAGAWGIVVPMVDTVEQAQIAIGAAKYPPVGNRSLGGGMHAMNFDTNGGEYFEKANDEILVVLQTESPTGVANAEQIYALPGVDAIFVGPVDLRANMRTAGRQGGQRRRVRGHARSASSPPARRPARPPACTRWTRRRRSRRAKQGMQFIAVGSELRMMTQKAQETLARVASRRRGEGPGEVLKVSGAGEG